MSCKAISKVNIPGLLLLGHPGGVNWYEQHFLTAADICDLGNQGVLYTKTILERPKH